MTNQVCNILGITKPVVCGPMAWISTAPLVAAVSNAGGLGILGVGFAPLDFAFEQIEQTKKLTTKPFGVNVILVPEILEHVTEIVLKTHVPVVYADSVGPIDSNLAQHYFKIWHKAGAKIIVKIGDVAGAKLLESAGADIIVAKGWEGGGHVSFEATTVLTPLVIDAVNVPVISSGGIADGRGMAAAFALGASGVELGTAFMASEETKIHENAKQAVIKAQDMQSVIVGTSTGEPCRQIQNSLSNKLMAIEAAKPFEEAAVEIKQLADNSLKEAMLNGDTDSKGAVMAGQIAPLVNEIRPAADILDSMITECKTVFANLQDITF